MAFIKKIKEFDRALITLGTRKESMKGTWDVFDDITYPG